MSSKAALTLIFGNITEKPVYCPESGLLEQLDHLHELRKL